MEGSISASSRLLKSPKDDDWGDFTLQYRKRGGTRSPSHRYSGGRMGMDSHPLESEKDLFYFLVLVGDALGRQSDYWQWDPAAKNYTSIGGGQSLDLSPDGNWAAWTDGFGGDWRSNQINVYEIGKNKN